MLKQKKGEKQEDLIEEMKTDLKRFVVVVKAKKAGRKLLIKLNPETTKI